MKDQIYLEYDGAIATVTLNQPERYNAMNENMWRGLGDLMGECDADTDLRCVIIRGAGGKAFSAGADIKEFETTRKDKKSAIVYGEATTYGFGSIIACRHPVVAQIDGLCVGGGMGIAFAATFVSAVFPASSVSRSKNLASLRRMKKCGLWSRSSVPTSRWRYYCWATSSRSPMR